jgi:hypothetical protein
MRRTIYFVVAGDVDAEDPGTGRGGFQEVFGNRWHLFTWQASRSRSAADAHEEFATE